MSRSALLLLSTAVVVACSDLSESEGGVVGLEIRTPDTRTIEVGQSLDLSARALDKNGDSVAADISWRAADPTLTVDALTGVITGVSAGIGRVQAFAGSLGSALLQFTITARADTLILVGDSVVIVGPGVAASTPLVSQVQTLAPAPGPIASYPVIYAITSPPDVGGPHTVELPGAVLVDTLTTGTDGAVSSVTLNRVIGIAQPDTAIVEIRAFRNDGNPVPGSGQRFIVLFQ